MVLLPPAVVNTNCSYPTAEYYSVSFKTCPLLAEHVFYVAFTISAYSDLTTAGPQRTSFCSTLFHYNVNKKKNHSGLGHSVCEVCRFFCVRVGFLLVLGFPPTPRPCAPEENWQFGSCLSECGCGWCTLHARESCPRWGPTLHPSCWEKFWPLLTLNWNQEVENHYLTCLY